MKTNKQRLLTEMALALGITALAQPASAAAVTFDWSGMMTLPDPSGAVLRNTSMSSKLNNAQTPISGTLTLDTATRAGSATMQPFYYFGNPIPMYPSGFHFQSAGGNLLMANMLINWGGASGFPVSLVLDASGLFAALPTSLSAGATISGVGVRPASDGTYVSQGENYLTYSGYLNRRGRAV